MTATALWIGFNPMLVEYFLIAAILGGVMAFAILKLRSSACGDDRREQPFPEELRRRAEGRSLWNRARSLRSSAVQSTALGVWAMQSLVQG